MASSNPQQAFMKGQLKLKGNMMLAQKLSVLSNSLPKGGAAAPAAAASAPAASGAKPAGDFKALAVLEGLKSQMNAELVKKVGATFRFDITNAAGAVAYWLVDLKNGEWIPLHGECQ